MERGMLLQDSLSSYISPSPGAAHSGTGIVLRLGFN